MDKTITLARIVFVVVRHKKSNFAWIKHGSAFTIEFYARFRCEWCLFVFHSIFSIRFFFHCHSFSCCFSTQFMLQVGYTVQIVLYKIILKSRNLKKIKTKLNTKCWPTSMLETTMNIKHCPWTHAEWKLGGNRNAKRDPIQLDVISVTPGLSRHNMARY